MKKFSLIIGLTILTVLGVYGQNLKQTLRGQITDIDTRQPLIGASIIVTDLGGQVGTTTDVNGYYEIKGVPVGRHQLKISYIGYEEQFISSLIITAGKEKVLDLALEESAETLNEVVVTAEEDKATALNEAAIISSRPFTVEETKRYPGSFGDPSRMASNFAGVSGDANGNNDIVIRGNSPKGLLWKMEGVEIPNPNHFSDVGASGGAISMLNNNILSNSDFMTGAFASEYGNALSGVFDINLRKGNAHEREYNVGVGILGTDVTAEGPFKKGYGGSYLVNYRYSTLVLLNAIGVKVAGDDIPKYQDASFKFYFPTKKAGEFTLFGIGGLSSIEESITEEGSDEVYYQGDYSFYMGTIGLKHHISLSKNSYLETTLSGSATKNYGTFDRLIDKNTPIMVDWGEDNFIDQAFRGQVIFSHKFNAKNKIKAGTINSLLTFNYLNKGYDLKDEEWETYLDEEGSAVLNQNFINWKHKFSNTVTLNAGVHTMWFGQTENVSIEPRLSVKWHVSNKDAFTLGYGVHSRIEPLPTYFVKHTGSNGNISMPNQYLDFTRANHFVLGYQHFFSDHLHLKAELYYQRLNNVPVESEISDENSASSSLNFTNGYVDIPMVNKGSGENYGVELTLERFFHKGYYFLATASLYESKYAMADGVMRDGMFNGNYVFNVLGGKEFYWTSKKGKNRTLMLSTKMVQAGGNRYTNILLDESIEAGETIVDSSNRFGQQWGDFLRFDLQLSLRTDKKKTTRTWKLDIQNVTNNSSNTSMGYNDYTKQIVYNQQLGLLPVLSYNISF